MKGHPDIHEALQNVLTMELTGINQYFLHAKMAKNWGIDRVAKHQWDESMDEMRHADKVMDRMLFLETEPNMMKYANIKPGHDIPSMFEADLALEHKALDVLREGLQKCFEHNDHATRELFEHILVDEEEHVDWLETQLELIGKIGIENYLTSQQFEG